MRTEVLSKLSAITLPLLIVTYPEAIAELVISKKQLDDQTLVMHQGDVLDVDATLEIYTDDDDEPTDSEMTGLATSAGITNFPEIS